MPIITDIKKAPSLFVERVNQGLPYKPLSVKLKIIDKCNLRCMMCNHWRRDVNALPYGFYLPVIKDLAELGCRRIHFTGGEPLLYPNLLLLMDYIKQCDCNIKISMTTNATLIDDNMAKALAQSGLTKANISIDSPEESLHDTIRGVPGAFNKACHGFQCLKKYMPQRSFYLNTVLSPWNYRTLIGLPKLAKELGAAGIHLMTLNVHTDEASPFTSSQLDVLKTDVLPALLDEAKRYDIPLEIPQLSSDAYYYSHRCYALFSHLLINCLGFVYPCCNLMETPIGDLHHNSIKEIWECKNYRELRKKQTLPIDSTCVTCDLFLENNKQIEELFFRTTN